VVHNFLTNAIKYSFAQDEFPIILSLEEKEKEFIISVQNKGMGIPQEDQHRIFEKFFRADNAIAVETDGSGLGLYIVKMMVKALGGTVRFESKENEFTTFYFSFLR
jgi:signal transduction histidine kinase